MCSLVRGLTMLLVGATIVGGATAAVGRPDPTHEPALAFTSPTNGMGVTVYTAALDRLGQRFRLLSAVRAKNQRWLPTSVAMSPDGKYLAFYRNHPNTSWWGHHCDYAASVRAVKAKAARPGCGDLWIMRTDGSGLRILTTDGSGFAAFSGDSKHIVYERDRCLKYDAERGTSRPLEFGCWHRTTDLAIVGLNGTGKHVLVRGRGWVLNKPDWSSDGQWILYGRWRDNWMGGDIRDSDISAVHPDGSGGHIVARAAAGDGIGDARFAPDSKLIAYNFAPGGFDLTMGLVNVDGTGRRLTNNLYFVGGWTSPSKAVVAQHNGSGYALATWDVADDESALGAIADSYFDDLLTISVISRPLG